MRLKVNLEIKPISTHERANSSKPIQNPKRQIGKHTKIGLVNIYTDYRKVR